MRIVVLLAILLVACATTKPTTRFWEGDCLERPDPYTNSICWGTLDALSTDLGHFALVNVKCDGAMKDYRRISVYISRRELQEFSQSVRCEKVKQ